MYVFHEAMNGCKNKSKDSLKVCFENVNTYVNMQLHIRNMQIFVEHYYQRSFIYPIQGCDSHTEDLTTLSKVLIVLLSKQKQQINSRPILCAILAAF